MVRNNHGTKDAYLDSGMVPLHCAHDVLGCWVLPDAVRPADSAVQPRFCVIVHDFVCRPRSMVGGDLHWLWKFYELYGSVDYVSINTLTLWRV